jgi:hypothetical protein
VEKMEDLKWTKEEIMDLILNNCDGEQAGWIVHVLQSSYYKEHWKKEVLRRRKIKGL